MAKRTGALVLALLLAFILPGAALEEGKVYTSGDYEYTRDSAVPDSISITAYHGKETDLVIPRQLDGFSVLSIGESAFQGNTSLESVTIPDGVVLVDRQGFSQCSRLRILNLGKTVKVIREYAFNRCDSLESVILPDNVTSVETGAFSYCKSLQSVFIGLGLQSFNGNNVFVGSVSLEKISLAPDHPTFYLKEKMLFEKTAEGNTLVCRPPALPGGALDIDAYCVGNDACSTCPGVTSVRFSENVVRIGTTSFANNSDLTSVTFTGNVSFIGGGAFSGTGIISAVIPEKVVSIEHATFADCRNLKDVTLPENLERIGDYSFYGCSSLLKLMIPGSVLFIGENALPLGPEILTVLKGSFAEEYCNRNNIQYKYYDSAIHD